MTRTALATLAVGLAIPLAGCASLPMGSDIQEQRPAMVKTLTGQLAYRERIALPPNAKVEVVLTDITHGTDQELVLARTVKSYERTSPPIPFRLDVSRLNASAGPLFGVRAFISDPDGRVLFRTSSPVLVDPRGDAADLGTIVLSMSGPGEGGVTSVPNIRGAEWTVAAINRDLTGVEPKPTITFGLDGRAFGSGGCNNFSSTYTLEGRSVTFAPIAANLRACAGPVMQQERAFFDVLNGVSSARIAENGLLVLETASGDRLYAHRSARM